MDKNNKKVFFFDFDGTLWFGKYGEKTLQALNILHEKGHLLIYNSGRSMGNTRFKRLEPIPFDGFLFGGNHAIICGKEIYRNDLSQSIISKVIETEKNLNLDLLYEGVNAVYKRKGILPFLNGEELDDITQLLDVEQFPVTKIDVIKKAINDEQPDFTNSKPTAFLPVAQEFFETFEQDFCFIQFDSYLECLPIGTGKDFISKKAIEYLNVSIENCYFFGDSLNDLPMFTLGGHNVAIGHAPKQLKNLAEYVTKEEENGVYEGLKFFNLID
jgi:HAD superfamily hydrolase (TIGR01484 family)